MNQRDSVPPEGNIPPEWRQAEDSLEDAAAESLPEGSAAWVAEQRFVHGLLRAEATADAASREARVVAILERIDAERAAAASRGRKVVPSLAERSSRWTFWLAATLLASLGLWAVLPERLPTAEAAVQRAVERLARDADLLYGLEATIESADGRERLHHRFALTTRPGMRMRVAGTLTFGTFALGEFELGCDGEEFWLRSANGLLKRSAPIGDRQDLAPGLGDMVDLGYLDVHELVRRLPEDFEIAVVGKEQAADGRSLLRLQAQDHKAGRSPALGRAELWCDEATGMVVRLEVETKRPGGAMHSLHFAYLGEADGPIDYRRPW